MAMVKTADVVVIGGGVVGAATAFRLAQAGARVTLVEAGRLAGGTSAASFAWLNASNKPPFAYHRLNTDGMAEHTRLAAEFGDAPWLHRTGNVAWGDTPERDARVGERVGRLRAWGYPAEWLTPAELRATEPDIALPPQVGRVASFPTEGYVDVPPLIGTLATEATRHGATVRVGFQVTKITQAGGRVAGIVAANGEGVAADAVVICAGRWSAAVAAGAGLRLPMENSVGLLSVTYPAPLRLRTMIDTETVNLRPDGAGRLRLQSTEFDGTVTVDTPPHPIPQGAYTVLERAERILPGLRGVGLAYATIAVRPIPADGHSAVGAMPGVEGLFLAVTHSAVTMGPLLGRLIAREVLTGEADERLTPFRPDRLVSAMP